MKYRTNNIRAGDNCLMMTMKCTGSKNTAATLCTRQNMDIAGMGPMIGGRMHNIT